MGFRSERADHGLSRGFGVVYDPNGDSGVSLDGDSFLVLEAAGSRCSIPPFLVASWTMGVATTATNGVDP